MMLSVTLKGVRVFAGVSFSQKILGVNSKLPDGRHFLMWDFDNVTEDALRSSLIAIQRRFRLSNIYMLNTGLVGYYHAFCFRRYAYPDAFRILASTENIDRMYLSLGAVRGYWTLRIVGKRGRETTHVGVLKSDMPENVNPLRVDNFAQYFTKRV